MKSKEILLDFSDCSLKQNMIKSDHVFIYQIPWVSIFFLYLVLGIQVEVENIMAGYSLLIERLNLGKIEGGRRRGWQRMRWLDGITDSMDMSLSKTFFQRRPTDGQWVLEKMCSTSVIISSVQFSSVVQSCPTLRLQESQHPRPPCPSPTPKVHPNSCPSSPWCHPAISSSVVLFFSCPQIPPSIRVFSNESTLHML